LVGLGALVMLVLEALLIGGWLALSQRTPFVLTPLAGSPVDRGNIIECALEWNVALKCRKPYEEGFSPLLRPGGGSSHSAGRIAKRVGRGRAVHRLCTRTQESIRNRAYLSIRVTSGTGTARSGAPRQADPGVSGGGYAGSCM
jgi:hypothetical protein